MQRYEKNLAYAWIMRDIFYFCCQNRQSMEQVLLFFLKVLTALAYVLALLSPFILIGWCFALCTSILYIVASQSDEPFESYLANKERKKEVQIAMVNIPSNQNYMNVINNVGYQSGTLNNPPQGQQIVMEKAQNYASL